MAQAGEDVGEMVWRDVDALRPLFQLPQNAATLSAADLKGIAQRSCAVLQQLGPSIQWVQSFVTEDKITCV
jgi:hypothetical protein